MTVVGDCKSSRNMSGPAQDAPGLLLPKQFTLSEAIQWRTASTLPRQRLGSGIGGEAFVRLSARERRS